jgi:hypothetical protein
MRTGWWRGVVLMGVAFLLGGCGAADVLGLAEGLLGGDNTSSADVVSALSRVWTVDSYSGTQAGSVTVPTSANMRWTINSNGTYTVTSATAVANGASTTRTYNEAGTWRVISTTSYTLGFTLTETAGQAIPLGSQSEVTGTYTMADSTDLVLSTGLLGPGTVRYVLSD